MQLAASCDIGVSWRDASLDASLELSTKVLEFGVLGLPVILNRTPMYFRNSSVPTTRSSPARPVRGGRHGGPGGR